VAKSAPAMYTWKPSHPLTKCLPKTIDHTVFLKPAYMYKVADNNAWVADRNGDGFPSLVSKPIGNASGVFVRCASVFKWWGGGGYTSDLKQWDHRIPLSELSFDCHRMCGHLLCKHVSCLSHVYSLIVAICLLDIYTAPDLLYRYGAGL
jgi:hypothetical protein